MGIVKDDTKNEQMTRLETIIAVKDVAKSSKWYQDLLDLESNHGGDNFEMLTAGSGTVILCLHRWGEHDHPTMTDPGITVGNGLILYFRVSVLDEIWSNAIRLNIDIEQEPHWNENSGQQQFILRDLDGYYLIISE
jgi:catechol-2,3-dioxygenase